MTDWYEGLAALRSAGVQVLALTLEPDAQDIGTVKLAPRVVLGSAGGGLSARWLSESDVRVTIPMAPRVDSLNVAAATAIGCYVLAHR